MSAHTSKPGLFVVSLDFELYWGIRDHTRLRDCRETLLGARRAVEVLLSLFERHSIHATWATVGMLFAHDRDELLRYAPALRPAYADARLSAYAELDQLGRNESDDPYHFAGSLVDRIAATPGQELGTHTFSHFYCLEPGATEQAFEADLLAARAIGERHGDVMRSLVFPRNQLNDAYRDVLRRVGVKGYRVNPRHWAYDAQPGAGETPSRRMLRLLDSYLPLTGARTAPAPADAAGPQPVPASAFLRPYTHRLRAFDPLRMRRLQTEMRDAAREGTMFHLWWHPHNFGRNLTENLTLLEQLIDEVGHLRREGRMESLSMAEARIDHG